MDAEPAVAYVLDRFNRLLEGDGARLDLVSVGADHIALRYVVGGEGACEACVLDPEELDVLVADALRRQGATFTSLTILHDAAR